MMTKPVFYNPTRIHFYAGCLNELGDQAKLYGERCLLVTPNVTASMSSLLNRAKEVLVKSGIKVFWYHGVIPNPTMTVVDEAVHLAHINQVDFVVAVGGGSAMDTAKLASYYAKVGTVDWENLWHHKSNPFDFTQLNPQALPIIAVSTTSGTGSQLTQCAVISSQENNQKKGIHRKEFFPKEAFVDPELMMSLPEFMTHCTAFDAFCHLSESWMSGRLCETLNRLAWEGMDILIKQLQQLHPPILLDQRVALAKADILAGLCLSNGGGTSIHHVGEMLTSAIEEINHGASLAISYPAFIYEFYDDERYHESINKILFKTGDCIPQNRREARQMMLDFLHKIPMKTSLQDYHPNDKQIQQLYQFLEQESGEDKQHFENMIQLAFEKEA